MLAVLPGDVPGARVGAGLGGDAGQLGLPAAPPGDGVGVMEKLGFPARQSVESLNPATQVPSQTPVPVVLKQEDPRLFSL